MTVSLELLGVALLILLNGFFVAAEYSLVTVRRTRLKELADEGSRPARAVMRITSDPPHFIAAMQLGVTLTSLAIGAIGEAVLSELFGVYLGHVLRRPARVPDHHLHARRRRRARAEGARAQLLRADRARRLRARAGVLLRLQAGDLVPAALERDRAARHRDRSRKDRGRGALGGRAADAARDVDRARRDRAGRARDALQGLRLRRQGGLGRDGSATRRRRHLDRDGARGGTARRARVAVHAVSGLSRSRSTRSSGSCTCAISSRRCTTAPSPRSSSRRCCVPPMSCPRRRISRRCWPSSGARTSTCRSSSTSTGRPSASSRSRICSRRSWARSRTSSTCRTSRSSGSTRRRSGSTARSRSTTSTRSSGRRSSTRTTTRSRGTSST